MEMNKINKWLKINKLKLNGNKYNNTNHDVIIEKGNKISWVFKEIKNIYQKWTEYIHLVKNRLPIITAINICDTRIKPFSEYKYVFQNLQKKAMRTNLKCNCFTSIQHMLIIHSSKNKINDTDLYKEN